MTLSDPNPQFQGHPIVVGELQTWCHAGFLVIAELRLVKKQHNQWLKITEMQNKEYITINYLKWSSHKV